MGRLKISMGHLPATFIANNTNRFDISVEYLNTKKGAQETAIKGFLSLNLRYLKLKSKKARDYSYSIVAYLFLDCSLTVTGTSWSMIGVIKNSHTDHGNEETNNRAGYFLQ